MGWFDGYSNAAPCAKNMRRNGITTFILHVAQCITFNKTIFFAEKIIAKARLKSLYIRLGFNVIKYFVTSTNFEEAHEQFHYD